MGEWKPPTKLLEPESVQQHEVPVDGECPLQHDEQIGISVAISPADALPQDEPTWLLAAKSDVPPKSDTRKIIVI